MPTPDHVPSITIDMDKKCSRCQKAGSAENGLCLDCISKTFDTLPIPSAADFHGLLEYLPAHELTPILETLLSTHPRFADLQGLKIALYWREKGGVSKGQPTLAKVNAVTGLTTIFTDVDFIIWFAADHLRLMHRDCRLPQRVAEALLYHELCHLWWDPEEGNAVIQGHEFEGFFDELERYADVRAELKKLRQVAQLPLFGETVQ